jgi:hypothetical protein
LRRGGDAKHSLTILSKAVVKEGGMSFAAENVAGLILETIDRSNVLDTQLARLTFSSDALRGRSFRRSHILDCYFQGTILSSDIHDVLFESCRFERLELAEKADQTLTFKACEFGSIALGDDQVFDPEEIVLVLRRIGFKVTNKSDAEPTITTPPSDELLKLAERSLRVFLRATHVNENVLKQRLGVKFTSYANDVLPALLQARVLEEVAYLGSGVQRRFRLAVPMQSIQRALQRSQGQFLKFLGELQAP